MGGWGDPPRSALDGSRSAMASRGWRRPVISRHSACPRVCFLLSQFVGHEAIMLCRWLRMRSATVVPC
jgi:hypothetical protein